MAETVRAADDDQPRSWVICSRLQALRMRVESPAANTRSVAERWRCSHRPWSNRTQIQHGRPASRPANWVMRWRRPWTLRPPRAARRHAPPSPASAIIDDASANSAWTAARSCPLPAAGSRRRGKHGHHHGRPQQENAHADQPQPVPPRFRRGAPAARQPGEARPGEGGREGETVSSTRTRSPRSSWTTTPSNTALFADAWSRKSTPVRHQHEPERGEA